MGKKWKQWHHIFLGSKITAVSDCSHEIKRCLLLGRKAMTNPDSVIKKWRYHFANKDPCSQSYGFSNSHVRKWEVDHKEGSMPKNWCLWIVLKRLLKVPWTTRSNQSILKEINREYSLEGLLLKLQYSSHLMQRANSLEKTLMLGKIEGRRRRGQQRMRWLDGVTNTMDELGQTLGNSERQRSLVCCSPWGCKNQTQLSYWTPTTNWRWDWVKNTLWPCLGNMVLASVWMREGRDC